MVPTCPKDIQRLSGMGFKVFLALPTLRKNIIPGPVGVTLEVVSGHLRDKVLGMDHRRLQCLPSK